MLSSTWSGKKKLFITAVLAAIVWAASSSPWFRAPQATEIYYVDQGTKAVASLEPAPFQPVESNKKAWAAPDSIAVNKEEVASPSPDQLVLNQSATTTDLNKLEDSAGLNRQILRYLAEQGQGVNFEVRTQILINYNKNPSSRYLSLYRPFYSYDADCSWARSGLGDA